METVQFKGKPLLLKGNIPDVGRQAPDFVLINNNLEEITLTSFGEKKKLLNIFPSLDTDVCSLSILNFYERVANLKNIILINISVDLPFAQKRFCQDKKNSNLQTLSAFRSSFPKDYGLLIQNSSLAGLCTRVVFVLSEKNEIIYREIVKEITLEPNYELPYEILIDKKTSK